jgi:hypothetical protein
VSSGPYTGVSCRLLKSLRSADKLKSDAFASYVKEATGRSVSDEQVRRWIVGLDHFPADLVPVLAAFLDDEDDKLRVLRTYAAPAGVRVEAERGVAEAPADALRDVLGPASDTMAALFAGLADGSFSPEDEARLLPAMRRFLKEGAEWVAAVESRQVTHPALTARRAS